MSTQGFILKIACPDRPGIVHAVSHFLFGETANILDSAQFSDTFTGRFFMRIHFDKTIKNLDLLELKKRFLDIGQKFDMEWELFDASSKPKVLIMVSKLGHCLNDLLFRTHSGYLPIEIAAIVSNHKDFEGLAKTYGIAFHHLPLSSATDARKDEQEQQLLDLIDQEKIDLVVLARYMQILSPAVCEKLAGKAINIHHSFLPSFKGAKPYWQAHQRGVKLIGATAHYVTTDLDEGPIIEQGVERVDHAMNPDQLAAVGRDVECMALSRAVRWHAEHRILLNGKSTVVFQ
ncbi:formyltetrahydrofolate deformylase [Polynucleobacter sp. MWH-Spelu-300-X4]|uniref:formyltetrahydrofolate deformylase n=1 Tax=Polynucleobacter sp. MWH-Spelu-300-X4 TaxID=2689109 RepID=UPI001BFD00B1|nr:formyltetrahydrofolate deformylase [Polynucleobacter sp. MWH-Spelu-300-X4]QWD79091.1 formyltetrahydrofolate deformylase [Polynucleobacter sp. MWH-Spelu-300-X4]